MRTVAKTRGGYLGGRCIQIQIIRRAVGEGIPRDLHGIFQNDPFADDPNAAPAVERGIIREGAAFHAQTGARHFINAAAAPGAIAADLAAGHEKGAVSAVAVAAEKNTAAVAVAEIFGIGHRIVFDFCIFRNRQRHAGTVCADAAAVFRIIFRYHRIARYGNG